MADSTPYLILVILVHTAAVSGEPVTKCTNPNPDTNSTAFKIADSQQCDLYYECASTGDLIDRLCDDGLVFNANVEECDYPHNVDCSGRETLQPSLSTNPQCPRLNAFIAYPAEESCSKFIHCLEGIPYEKNCPAGVIFDSTIATCTHPDRSKRKECHGTVIHGFQCPKETTKYRYKFRFGDHDRIANPDSCRKFYICMRGGHFRVGSCPVGKVFNPKTGLCDAPKKVPGCEDYYGKKSKTQLLQELDEEVLKSSDEKDLDAFIDSIRNPDNENTVNVESVEPVKN